MDSSLPAATIGTLPTVAAEPPADVARPARAPIATGNRASTGVGTAG
jgi:hypothetical protein